MAQPTGKKSSPTMLDKLKAYVSPGSTTGTLRDRKKKLDAEINRQTSSTTSKTKKPTRLA